MTLAMGGVRDLFQVIRSTNRSCLEFNKTCYYIDQGLVV